MRHLIVVLELTLHVNRCSLARATGPVFSHGSFCLMKISGRLRGVRGGTIKFLDPFYESHGLNFASQLTSNVSCPAKT